MHIKSLKSLFSYYFILKSSWKLRLLLLKENTVFKFNQKSLNYVFIQKLFGCLFIHVNQSGHVRLEPRSRGKILWNSAPLPGNFPSSNCPRKWKGCFVNPSGWINLLHLNTSMWSWDKHTVAGCQIFFFQIIVPSGQVSKLATFGVNASLTSWACVHNLDGEQEASAVGPLLSVFPSWYLKGENATHPSCLQVVIVGASVRWRQRQPPPSQPSDCPNPDTITTPPTPPPQTGQTREMSVSESHHQSSWRNYPSLSDSHKPTNRLSFHSEAFRCLFSYWGFSPNQGTQKKKIKEKPDQMYGNRSKFWDCLI